MFCFYYLIICGVIAWPTCYESFAKFRKKVLCAKIFRIQDKAGKMRKFWFIYCCKILKMNWESKALFLPLPIKFNISYYYFYYYYILWFTLTTHKSWQGCQQRHTLFRLPSRRDGKTFQRASNAGVNCFLPRVKCVPNFTLFCCKSELCCNFALFGVIIKDFYLLNFLILLSK